MEEKKKKEGKSFSITWEAEVSFFIGKT